MRQTLRVASGVIVGDAVVGAERLVRVCNTLPHFHFAFGVCIVLETLYRLFKRCGLDITEGAFVRSYARDGEWRFGPGVKWLMSISP